MLSESDVKEMWDHLSPELSGYDEALAPKVEEFFGPDLGHEKAMEISRILILLGLELGRDRAEGLFREG